MTTTHPPDSRHSWVRGDSYKGACPLVFLYAMVSCIYMITWVTHNSRVSERMVEFGVQRGAAVFLDLDQEIQVMGYIRDVVVGSGLKVMDANICGDHVHMVLVCGEGERSGIVGKLKSISSRRYNVSRGWTVPRPKQGGMPPCATTAVRGVTQSILWAQKYHWNEVTDEYYLSNALNYIHRNRTKHRLPASQELDSIIESMCISIDDAF